MIEKKSITSEDEGFEKICDRLAKLLIRKNKQYGQAYITSANILKILYPGGIQIIDYEEVLLIVRICDKLSRITSPFRVLEDESPFQDIAGYGILGQQRWEQRRHEDVEKT